MGITRPKRVVSMHLMSPLQMNQTGKVLIYKKMCRLIHGVILMSIASRVKKMTMTYFYKKSTSHFSSRGDLCRAWKCDLATMVIGMPATNFIVAVIAKQIDVINVITENFDKV